MLFHLTTRNHFPFLYAQHSSTLSHLKILNFHWPRQRVPFRDFLFSRRQNYLKMIDPQVPRQRQRNGFVFLWMHLTKMQMVYKLKYKHKIKEPEPSESRSFGTYGLRSVKIVLPHHKGPFEKGDDTKRASPDWTRPFLHALLDLPSTWYNTRTCLCFINNKNTEQ